MTEGGEEINTGGNASAEGGGEELDDNVKIVDAIEHTFHLQEYEMSATALKTYLKSYYQAMRKAKKEAGVPQDEIKAFMATAPTACKFLLTKVKDCEVFINEDFDDKGAICLREWAEQGNVYYYIEPGLERAAEPRAAAPAASAASRSCRRGASPRACGSSRRRRRARTRATSRRACGRRRA